jgi:hypothetical protein
MLPVLLQVPEEVWHRATGIATSPTANKVTDKSKRILRNLPLTESEQTIASGIVVIIVVGNNDAVDLGIVLIPVESQRSRLRAAPEG